MAQKRQTKPTNNQLPNNPNITKRPTKNLPTYIHKTEKTIQTTPFTTKHKTKPTYFTRNTAKMTLDKLIAYQLTLPRQSAQIAINNLNRYKQLYTQKRLRIHLGQTKLL
jgi:hypothetical protein